MSLNASKVQGSGGNFKRPDALDIGSYPARVVQVIDMGIQAQRPYKGEDKAPAHEIRVVYECSDEFMKDEEGNEITDKPRWVSEEFPFHPLKADLAKSTKRYKAIDPALDHDGDWTKLIGAPCMITIAHGYNKKDPEKPYENVSNVSPATPKVVARMPELQNEPKVFELDDPDMDVFLSLPTFLQDKIKSNLEFKGSALEKALEVHASKGKGVAKGKPQKAPVEAPEGSEDDVDNEQGEW